MDWYYGSGIDDSLVPRDQDLLDRLPSPDSWSNWGISAPEAFNPLEMFFIMNTNPTEVELNVNDRSCNKKIELGYSLHDKDQSTSSSVCEGFPEQSFQKTAFSCGHHNFQLQDLSRFEQMDDSFLDFVLEDLPCVENVNKSYFFYPDLQSSVTPGRLQKDFAASQFVPCYLESNGCLDIEGSSIIVLDPFEPIIRDEGIHQEFSVEEFILQDFQMAIAQFTTKSRICFRDALYRLATDTKQEHVVQDQKNMQQTDHNKSIRSMNKKPIMESWTNTVDGAVACRMFKKKQINSRSSSYNTWKLSNP